MPERVTRRTFARRAALVAGAAAVGPTLLRTGASGAAVRGDPLLSLAAKECPIDTVVVLMMENRSFDHYLGWLGATRPTSMRVDGAGVRASRSRRGSMSAIATPPGS